MVFFFAADSKRLIDVQVIALNDLVLDGPIGNSSNEVSSSLFPDATLISLKETARIQENYRSSDICFLSTLEKNLDMVQVVKMALQGRPSFMTTGQLQPGDNMKTFSFVDGEIIP